LMICGIDEAGRGPVLGPLVVAAVMVEDDAALREIGVRDSKKLSPAKRERLAVKILEMSAVQFEIAEAEKIDSMRSEMSLNVLEAEMFASLIERMRPETAYVDSCESDEIGFSRQVSSRLSYRPNIICENKADVKYPVVSAASIVAKTHRDALMRRLEEQLCQSIGSGYCSDPATCAFINDWIERTGNLPPQTRRSWITARRALSVSKNAKLTDWD